MGPRNAAELRSRQARVRAAELAVARQQEQQALLRELRLPMTLTLAVALFAATANPLWDRMRSGTHQGFNAVAATAEEGIVRARPLPMQVNEQAGLDGNPMDSVSDFAVEPESYERSTVVNADTLRGQESTTIDGLTIQRDGDRVRFELPDARRHIAE